MTDSLPRVSAGSPISVLVREMEEFDKLKKKVQRATVNEPMKCVKDTIETLGNQQVQALQKSTAVSAHLAKLSSLEAAVNALYAIALVVQGLYLRTQDGKRVEGERLAQAGVFLLTQTIMAYTGLWDDVAKVASFGNKRVEWVLAVGLPPVVSIGVHWWAVKKISELGDDDKKRMEGVGRVLQVTSGALSIGQFYLKIQQGSADREYQYLDSQLSVEGIRLNQLFQRRTAVEDLFSPIINGLKGVVQNMFSTAADSARNN